jgi:hypothetical protein
MASIAHENPGRIAQRESVPFTRERSKVRSLVRPPEPLIKSDIFQSRRIEHAAKAISSLDKGAWLKVAEEWLKLALSVEAKRPK